MKRIAEASTSQYDMIDGFVEEVIMEEGSWPLMLFLLGECAIDVSAVCSKLVVSTWRSI